MNPTITYVSEKELGEPLFGICYDSGLIKINSELPKVVQEFVLEHELYHFNDMKNWAGKTGMANFLRKEFLANFSAALKHPNGFILTMLLSLSPRRLSFYWKRFKNKQ
jgi:hypothetical protein